jgi:hypothetical protein
MSINAKPFTVFVEDSILLDVAIDCDAPAGP